MTDKFIVTRDGTSYSTLYYRLEGNTLQVRYTSLEGTDNHLYIINRWKDVKEVEL
jgi:hypothetical protein